MDFSELMQGIVTFAQNHAVMAIVLALVLLFLMYRRPKLFFSILLFGLLLAGLLYMITNMAGLGSDQKRKLIHEEEKQVDNGG